MTVLTTLTLPAQPALGFVKPRPLGGNGFTGPFSQQVVQVIVASDGTGGTNNIVIELDPVYLNLVSNVQASINDAIADVNVRMQVTAPLAEFLAHNGVIPFLDPGAGSLNNNLLWSPPPLLQTDVNTSGDATINVASENTNTETLIVSAWIYQFDKRAAEFVPAEVLLAVLSRGTTIT